MIRRLAVSGFIFLILAGAALAAARAFPLPQGPGLIAIGVTLLGLMVALVWVASRSPDNP